MKDSPKPGTSGAGPSKPQSDGILNDPRFAHLVSDPRFKNIHKSTKSVKIDNRFKSMFKDDQFKVKYTSDKYGRRVNKTSTEDLEKYYHLSSDEDEVEEKRKEEAELVKEANGGANDGLQIDEEISGDVRDKLKDLQVDYARGEAALWSDSSSDDESSDDEGKEIFIEHVWGELDNDAPRTEDSTRRLAACNMDWDRMRAPDIMVLCNSFLPPGGSIVKVAIYPSEYGKERMAEEEVRGPQELVESSAVQPEAELSDSDDVDSVDSDVDSDNEEGDDYHMEKLRQYQLNRLKYYYAIIECNSVHAADKLYQECDGLEYESTATKLDLRFIPDDMTFDDEPKEVCTELPDLAKYKPRLFTTTALQQAKVELTWDENDVDRKELTEKMSSGKLEGISDADLRKYVAYSSEEESDDEQGATGYLKRNKNSKKIVAKTSKVAAIESDGTDASDDEDADNAPKKGNIISMYKDLLKDINEKESEKKKNRIEMEFSWGIGSAKDKQSGKSDVAVRTEELTPFEKIIEKKRAKKKARKDEIKQLKKAQRRGDDDSGDSESDDDLPDGVDLNDPYFAEEFASGEYAESKKSSKQKSEELKKKKKNNQASDDEENEQKEKELALLLNDDDDNRAHFSLKKIQENENESKSRKRKKLLKAKKNGGVVANEQEDDFKIDVNDGRFSAIYSSHLFNIDPTHSHYKKTKAMDTIIQEKLKRKPSELTETDTNTDAQPDQKKPKKDVALQMLVKNLKRKVKQN